MTFRYPTRPLYSVQDELDRLYEQWPADERPLFPPSPSLTARGQHQAPTAASPSPPAAAVGASVPGDES